MKNQFIDDKGYYKEKTESEIKASVNRILELWNKFLISQGMGNLVCNKDYFIHTRNIYEVVKRYDKRKTYYYVFHKIEEICEYKELGLLCYWINTLKPFMVVNEKCNIYNAPNEMFSLYLILSALARISKEYYPDKEFQFPSPEMVQDYVYNFKYCDLNREAMIFFVETLAKSYGIGMDIKMSKDIK